MGDVKHECDMVPRNETWLLDPRFTHCPWCGVELDTLLPPPDGWRVVGSDRKRPVYLIHDATNASVMLLRKDVWGWWKSDNTARHDGDVSNRDGGMREAMRRALGGADGE